MKEEILIKKTFRNHGLNEGRMISGSKSGYRELHKGNDILFNCNIFIESEKIWWGDLDITEDKSNLQKIANDLDEELIILPELLGRFGEEFRPIEEIKNDAHAIFTPHETEYLSRAYDGIKGVNVDGIVIAVPKGVDWGKLNSYDDRINPLYCETMEWAEDIITHKYEYLNQLCDDEDMLDNLLKFAEDYYQTKLKELKERNKIK